MCVYAYICLEISIFHQRDLDKGVGGGRFSLCNAVKVFFSLSVPLPSFSLLMSTQFQVCQGQRGAGRDSIRDVWNNCGSEVYDS